MARARRGRNEGAIYQRPDGRWIGMASVGYYADGRRRRKVVYGKSKREVQDKLRGIQNTGNVPDAAKITVADYITRWLANTAAKSVSPTTLARYTLVLERYVVPFIGHYLLTRVSPLMVEQLYADQAAAGASDRNRQMSGNVLYGVFKQAARLGLIQHNPCADAKPPKAKRKELATWTGPEAKAFLTAAKDDRLYALLVLAVATGARQGELFALHWPDVDLAGGAIMIQRTLEELKGVMRLKEPKTKAGKRRVNLPPVAVKALEDHRRAMLAEGFTSGPVFCDTNGGFLRKSNFARRTFKPLIADANVPPIRFHDLRHTAATLLLMMGENPKVVSERLGHASIEITLNTYSHVMPTMQAAAAEKIEKLLG